MKSFQSVIFDLTNSDTKKIDIKLNIFNKKILKYLKEDGILWVLCNFYKSKNVLVPAPFYIAEKLNNFFLKNIIVVPNFQEHIDGNIFNNYITNILFLTKSNDFYFNKDPIREKHIWKNVEWGKRKKNYHPKGKDPGNVWLKTDDDGKANITNHRQLNYAEIIERCIKCSIKKESSILLLNTKKINTKQKITYEKI